ncbi:MAG: START-like domain-containing protein [Candidatus Paceibacterales bacterium]
MANDTILEVTDFAEAKEIKDQTFLWDKQVEDLKHALGAI